MKNSFLHKAEVRGRKVKKKPHIIRVSGRWNRDYSWFVVDETCKMCGKLRQDDWNATNPTGGKGRYCYLNVLFWMHCDLIIIPIFFLTVSLKLCILCNLLKQCIINWLKYTVIKRFAIKVYFWLFIKNESKKFT